MNINDPSLWPDELGDLRFEPLEDGGTDDIMVISENEGTLAMLIRHHEPWLATLGSQGVIEIPPGSGWELLLPGRGPDLLERRLLYRPGREATAGLTDDVIAWATLTVLIQRAGHVPRQG
jgi:hypothetical protein